VARWVRRLRADHGEGRGGLAVHRSSDPGHWIVTFPWTGAERALAIAEAATALAARDIPAARTAGASSELSAGQRRSVERWSDGIRAARATPPAWIRDADRRIPIVSVSGTNGKSTVSRLITHVLLRGGRHVGTTTSDGILVDERWSIPATGPAGGAQQILARRDVDVAVLGTARGGILLRGVGYGRTMPVSDERVVGPLDLRIHTARLAR
jgi:cyanophycin synthetase